MRYFASVSRCEFAKNDDSVPKTKNAKTLVMVPQLLYTLADQAHNTTSGQFTLFHQIHQQNLNVCMPKCDESIEKCYTNSENPNSEFSFIFVEF